MFELPYLAMMKLDDGDNGGDRRSPSHGVDVRVSGPMSFPSPGGPASAASQEREVAGVRARPRLCSGTTGSKTGCHPAERRYLPVKTVTA
jgi:hypothetical protein